MANFAVAEELIDFLNAAPTAFHAVQEAKQRLQKAGFKHVSEREAWTVEPGGKYFFTRNYSTIVAFAVGNNYKPGNGFLIIGAHTDSPCPKLKPVSRVTKHGFMEVGVSTYGGGLWHTWFDRDLTIAGRVVLKRRTGEKSVYSHELVRLKDPIMRIPTLAIHLDRGVNDGFKINTQTQFAPVLASLVKAEANRPAVTNGEGNSPSDVKEHVVDHHPLLLQLLADELSCKPEEIIDFDLQACDTQPSLIGGALKEFVFSGRLDNLCSSFCCLKALIDSSADLSDEVGIRMIALFDHEEIGSQSAQGAGSPVLIDALRRITSISRGSDEGLLERAIQKSFLVSADMAHCLHPNYPDKHEENHQPKMHKGLVIKDNANQRYATNAITSFIFREIAKLRNLPTQNFVVRNDMACGSTIGPILASGIGIRTVDVGAPQLSMHSIREMCGVDDVGYSYNHFKAFFEDFSALDAQLAVDEP
jgi:aspartyl aminopeptidase